MTAPELPPRITHRAADWFEGHVASKPMRFLMIGVFNSAFAYAAFAGLQLSLGRWIHYLVVLVIANVVSILEAYIMQRWLVWRVTGRWWPELVRFSGVYLVAFAINAALLPLLHEVLHIDLLVAQGVIMVCNAVGTYVIHRRFTFRRR